MTQRLIQKIAFDRRKWKRKECLAWCHAHELDYLRIQAKHDSYEVTLFDIPDQVCIIHNFNIGRGIIIYVHFLECNFENKYRCDVA